MKKIMLLTLFIGIHLRVTCQDFKPPNKSYIEIRKAGLTEVMIPTLFISTKTIHFPLRRIDTVGLHFHGNISPEWVDNFLRYRYQNIKTDPNTYAVLKAFINNKSQQKFYTNTLKSNDNGIDDYEITVDGKIVHVYYKYLHFFFKILVNELANKECDPVVIEKLKFYRD